MPIDNDQAGKQLKASSAISSTRWKTVLFRITESSASDSKLPAPRTGDVARAREQAPSRRRFTWAHGGGWDPGGPRTQGRGERHRGQREPAATFPAARPLTRDRSHDCPAPLRSRPQSMAPVQSTLPRVGARERKQPRSAHIPSRTPDRIV